MEFQKEKKRVRFSMLFKNFTWHIEKNAEQNKNNKIMILMVEKANQIKSENIFCNNDNSNEEKERERESRSVNLFFHQEKKYICVEIFHKN